jgi:hypothetical protein
MVLMKRLKLAKFYLLVFILLSISCDKVIGYTSCGLVSDGLMLRRKYSDQELLKLGFFVDFENSDNRTLRFTKVLSQTIENKELHVIIDLDRLENNELVHCTGITYLEGMDLSPGETTKILKAWGSGNLFSQAKLEFIQSSSDFFYIKHSWACKTKP